MSNIKWESSKHLEAGNPEPSAELHSDLLTLYSMRYCPYAQRTRLVLQHKQIPHQVINVNLVKKPDWFLAKSATGKVPVLREPDGWTLIESLITADYLEEKHPDEHPLYPKDPRQRARIRLSIGKMSDTLIPAFYRFSFADSASQTTEWENLLKALDAMQTDLGDSHFFGASDKLQMADLMLWPWFERLAPLCQMLGLELPKERFGALSAWIDRMGKERAVIEVRCPDEVHISFIKSYRAKNPQYDGY